MSLESLQAVARTLNKEQLTAGMVIGLQWAVTYIDDEMYSSFADELVSQRDVAVVEVIREWLVGVSNDMIRGKLQVGQFEIGSVYD